MTYAILIPAYNAAATLGATLESIASQGLETLQKIQRIIVADDGSTDTTSQIASDFAKSSEVLVEVWLAPANRGERANVNAAFEKLLQQAIKWCFVLHADDVAKPGWLSALLPLAEQAPGSVVSLCTSWDEWYPPDRIGEGQNDLSIEKTVIQGTMAAAKDTLNSGCWWHFSGCAMQLESFFRVGPFHEGMPQLGDLEWLIRSEIAGLDIWYVPRSLIKYRQTQTNVSATSFRTNRDLKETIMIFDILSNQSEIRARLPQYAKRQTWRALRRSVKSLLTGQWYRAVTAARFAWCLFIRYCGFRAVS